MAIPPEETAAVAAIEKDGTVKYQQLEKSEWPPAAVFDIRTIVGRYQMADALGEFCQAISTMQLKEIRDGKLYHQLKGQSGIDPKGNPIEDLGTWEGFSRSIGISKAKANENIQNLEHFGPALMDKMQLAGIGRDNLRRLRKLPEQELQEIEGRVVNTKDKNEVVDLIEDIIEAKQEISRERDALRREVRHEKVLREKAVMDREDLRDRLMEHEDPAGNWSLTAQEVREESTVLSALARDALDHMEQLLGKLASPVIEDLDPASPEFSAAARTLWVNLHAVQALASKHLAQFQEALGEDYIVKGMGEEPVMDPDEADRVLSRARMLVAAANGKALSRASSRQQSKPGRGRPKGSKNKAKG